MHLIGRTVQFWSTFSGWWKNRPKNLFSPKHHRNQIYALWIQSWNLRRSFDQRTWIHSWNFPRANAGSPSRPSQILQIAEHIAMPRSTKSTVGGPRRYTSYFSRGPNNSNDFGVKYNPSEYPINKAIYRECENTSICNGKLPTLQDLLLLSSKSTCVTRNQAGHILRWFA